MLLSDLKTVEVHPIFGSETVEMYTIFGSEDAILSGVQGAKPPGKAGGFGGPRGPPMRGMVGGWYSQWILGDDTISGDGQGWVDLESEASKRDAKLPNTNTLAAG